MSLGKKTILINIVLALTQMVESAGGVAFDTTRMKG
jgi:hypothetical protein